MLGYMTKKEALREGFTHHGSYYGIPLWIGDPDGEFIVATKWAPMEYLMSAAHHIGALLTAAFFPDEEPAFRFLVGKQI